MDEIPLELHGSWISGKTETVINCFVVDYTFTRKCTDLIIIINVDDHNKNFE